MFSFPCTCAAVNDKGLDVQFRMEETCWSLHTHLVGTRHSTVISTSWVKNTFIYRLPGSTCFLSSSETKGTRREMVECNSAASIEHNQNSAITPRLVSGCGNFPLPNISAEVFLTYHRQLVTSCSNGSLWQTHVPKVHYASPWDFSAGFPGKNIVNDGWMPGCIFKMNRFTDLFRAWGSRAWLTSKIPGMWRPNMG